MPWIFTYKNFKCTQKQSNVMKYITHHPTSTAMNALPLTSPLLDLLCASQSVSESVSCCLSSCLKVFSHGSPYVALVLPSLFSSEVPGNAHEPSHIPACFSFLSPCFIMNISFCPTFIHELIAVTNLIFKY